MIALADAAQTIETIAFDLADQHPSDVIAQLILIAAELERVVSAMKGVRCYSLREN